jgi:hypothetical protein
VRPENQDHRENILPGAAKAYYRLTHIIWNITLHNTVVTDNYGVHSPQLDRRDSKSD